MKSRFQFKNVELFIVFFINSFLIFFSRINFHLKQSSESITPKGKQQRPWDVHFFFFWTWNFLSCSSFHLLFLFLVCSKWSACSWRAHSHQALKGMLFRRLQNSILSWELVTSTSSPFSEVSGEKNPFSCKFWEDSHFTSNAEMGKNTCLPSNGMHLVVRMHQTTLHFVQ